MSQLQSICAYTHIHRTYLGGNYEESVGSFEGSQGFGEVSSINVGDKVDIGATLVVRFESFCHHVGPLRGEGKEGRGEGRGGNV